MLREGLEQRLAPFDVGRIGRRRRQHETRLERQAGQLPVGQDLSQPQLLVRALEQPAIAAECSGGGLQCGVHQRSGEPRKDVLVNREQAQREGATFPTHRSRGRGHER